MEAQYIYLLQEREFIKTKENIFKIGKTKQINNCRLKQYPKGSILLLQIICSNCDVIEYALIKIFKEKYKQCKDIGNEYFDGDYNDMIKTINENISIYTKYDTVKQLKPVKIKVEKIIENRIEIQENAKPLENVLITTDNTDNNSIENTEIVSCFLCNKNYASKRSLLNHRKNIHGICKETKKCPEDRLYHCKFCNKGYKIIQSRWAHQKKCQYIPGTVQIAQYITTI